MSNDQHLIDLATGIQRWRDFTAHLTGFLAGVAALVALRVLGIHGDGLLIAALTAWAVALSFQHFSQVIRGLVSLKALPAAPAEQAGDRPDRRTAGITESCGGTCTSGPHVGISR